MFRKFVPMVLAGYALWQWNQRHRQRALTHKVGLSRAKPAPVVSWEGEGGALRGVASPPA